MLLYRTLQMVYRVRNSYGTLILLALCLSGFTFSLMLYTTPWVYDNQCLREIENTPDPIVIQNGTKADIIAKFLEIYDVDLKSDSSLQDPGHEAESWVNCKQVQPDSSEHLGAVLKWLSTVPITKTISGVGGNSSITKFTGQTAKFVFELEGGYKALFKVKSFERDDVTHLDDMRHRIERHNAEIATYHLQRILGMNRAPITVGRYVDFTREILPVADKNIVDKFYYKGNDVCIPLSRKFKRGKEFQISVCAENGIFEGTMILWLPRDLCLTDIHLWVPHTGPGMWYEKFDVNNVYPQLENNHIKSLDFVDTILLDYLIQNSDRNALFYEFSTYSSIFLLDHGKSFADPFVDLDMILGGFSQICRIRKSTYLRLRLLKGNVLSTVLRHILSKDPLSPVLWEPHYEALDRRLVNILNSVDGCIRKHGAQNVIIDNTYSSKESYFTLDQFYITLRYRIGYCITSYK